MATQTSVLSVLFWLSAAALLPLSESRAFLGYDPKMQAAALRMELQDMIVEALGQGHSISLDRLNKINETIAPIFTSLPKNEAWLDYEQGRIDAPSMRHVLYRYFGDVRGWFLKGFEPHAVNTSADSGVGKILRSKLPGYADAVIEREMAHSGFTLHDTVSAVVVVEELIFDEALRALNHAYSMHGHAVMEPLSQPDVLAVLRSFAIQEISEAASQGEKIVDETNIQDIYPNWEQTTLFLDDMVSDRSHQHRHSANPFAERQYHFEDAARIAQDFTQEFSRWSNHECEDIKTALVEMDAHATGRVRLADFYQLSQGGAWQFLEPADYLRQLGALDESSASLGPQVMIPNYVTGMSNCISATPFYTSCCWNECMTLQRTLEGHIREPVAPASEIAHAIEQMSSSTQDARNLSLPLRARLDEVADFHGGKVPLHGRLFAQWIHFVFPRECPFPHMSGTVNPLMMGEHLDAGEDVEEKLQQDIQKHLNSDHAKVPASPEAGASMWNLQEELIATHKVSKRQGSPRAVLRTGALVVVMLAFVFLVGHQLAHLRNFVSGAVYHSGKKDVKEYMV